MTEPTQIVPSNPPSKDAIDAAWLRGFNEAHESHHTQHHETYLLARRVRTRKHGGGVDALRDVLPPIDAEGISK